MIDTLGADYARDFPMWSRKKFRLLTRDARASDISNLRKNLRARAYANLSLLNKKMLFLNGGHFLPATADFILFL